MQGQQLQLVFPERRPSSMMPSSELLLTLENLRKSDPVTKYEIAVNPYEKKYGIRWWEQGKWEWLFI